MISAQILAVLKKNHHIEEKTSKPVTIDQIRKLYPSPSSLLKDKSPLATLYDEINQLLNLLEKDQPIKDLLITKVAHLGFAKNQLQEVEVPENLLHFLQEIEKIFSQPNDSEKLKVFRL